jgi:hypothetical protein
MEDQRRENAMSKYDWLGRFLTDDRHDTIELTFGFINERTPGGLPPSARDPYSAWWGNTTNSQRVQAHVWMGAGYVAKVDFKRSTVVFHRSG